MSEDMLLELNGLTMIYILYCDMPRDGYGKVIGFPIKYPAGSNWYPCALPCRLSSLINRMIPYCLSGLYILVSVGLRSDISSLLDPESDVDLDL